MKYHIQWVLLLILICLYAFNSIRQDHTHNAFFRDMREFKNFEEQGERFTAADGAVLDGKIMHLHDQFEAFVNEHDKTHNGNER